MLLSELSEIIDSAIINEEVVEFPYLGSRGVELRVLSPYEASEDGETVLGYDHARAALRRFNYSKIIDIIATDEDYVKPIDQGGL